MQYLIFYCIALLKISSYWLLGDCTVLNWFVKFYKYCTIGNKKIFLATYISALVYSSVLYLSNNFSFM